MKPKYLKLKHKPEPLKYIVTGTGRCGTVYMAKLLTSLGFPCTHEAMFTPEATIVGYPKRGPNSLVSTADGKWLKDGDEIVAEASYMSAPHLSSLKSKIIHVVRDPIRVVFSFLDKFDYFKHRSHNGDRYQRFIYSHLPILTTDIDPVTRACLFYVEWNEMIEKAKPNFFYNVESNVDKLKEFLQVKTSKYFKNRNANSRCNSFTHTYDDIPESDTKDRFVEMAKRYGYTIISS
jgi:hypothetical protein